MICAVFEKTEEGYKVDAEWRGYGNANIIEAFEMENIDIKHELDNMDIGETKAYNIGWYNGCGVKKRGVQSEVIDFEKNFNKENTIPEYDIIKAIKEVIEECISFDSGRVQIKDNRGNIKLWLESGWCYSPDKQDEVIELMFCYSDTGRVAYSKLIDPENMTVI